jgi:SAM-dependent methyltransferase
LPREETAVKGGFDYPKEYVKYVDVFRQRYFHYENIVNAIDSLFPNGHAGRRLLDLGCGTGTFALAMARNGYDVLGTDAHEESIALARERGKGCGNATFVLQDFRRPALEGVFDVITILHIPISMDDMRATLAKYAPYVADGGYLVQLYLRKAANVVSDDKVDIDRYGDPAGKFKVVRFNQWLLNDMKLDFISVVLIEENGSVRLEFDKAKMQLLGGQDSFEHAGYKQVQDIPTRNRESAPPWTEEFLQILATNRPGVRHA